MQLKNIFIFIGIAIMSTACYYDNAEDLYQNFPKDCDVSAVSYSADVQPIIDQSCLSCHGPIAPQAGLDLSTHASLSASKEKVRNRINKPIGDPLVMPQGGPMIKCNIDKINAWIDQGALNN
jgi:hypothetical protein